jgi:hypothetical protein
VNFDPNLENCQGQFFFKGVYNSNKKEEKSLEDKNINDYLINVAKRKVFGSGAFSF